MIASTGAVALLPAYPSNLLPWSVTSRPLEGEAPTIDLVLGYNKANTSPILKLLLSRIDHLTAQISSKARRTRGPGSVAAKPRECRYWGGGPRQTFDPRRRTSTLRANSGRSISALVRRTSK
jgi:hypothetical protein